MRHQGRSAKGGRTTGGPRRVSAAEDPVSAPGHGCRSGRLRAGGWRASNGRLDVSVTCRAAAKLEFGHFTRQRRAGISAHPDSESGLGKALAQSEPALQDNRRQDARATLLWGRPSRNPNPPCKTIAGRMPAPRCYGEGPRAIRTHPARAGAASATWALGGCKVMRRARRMPAPRQASATLALSGRKSQVKAAFPGWGNALGSRVVLSCCRGGLGLRDGFPRALP
jgi:hypothetical protein